uniref:Uncharacterized protein n=1 Tax=Pseudomonas phage PMBT23 TaxID=3137284 RepID=A0AAU8BV10_9VIRU
MPIRARLLLIQVVKERGSSVVGRVYQPIQCQSVVAVNLVDVAYSTVFESVVKRLFHPIVFRYLETFGTRRIAGQ